MGAGSPLNVNFQKICTSPYLSFGARKKIRKEAIAISNIEDIRDELAAVFVGGYDKGGLFYQMIEKN